MTSHQPAKLVAKWLPNGFSIPNTELHPVIFYFGDQLRGSFFIGKNVVSAPIAYNEWGVLIPDVMRDGSTEHLILVLKMICNYPVAAGVAQFVYGYNKQQGDLRWTGNHFKASQKDLVMGIEVYDPVAGDQAQITELNKIFSQRVIGVDGKGTTHYSNWHFDDRVAETWQFGARYEVKTPFVRGVEPFTGTVDSCHGLMVRGMNWKITLPTLT